MYVNWFETILHTLVKLHEMFLFCKFNVCAMRLSWR